MAMIQLKKGLDQSFSTNSIKARFKKQKLGDDLIDLLNNQFKNLVFDEGIRIEKDKLLEMFDKTEDLHFNLENDEDNFTCDEKAIYDLDSIIKSKLDLKVVDEYNQRINLISGHRRYYTYAVGLKSFDNHLIILT